MKIKTYSNITVIAELLNLKGLNNQTPILYKKTSSSFKKQFGIDLQSAPLIFVKHSKIWKLAHNTYQSRGRVYEYATYHPVVDVKDKFKSLSVKIKTVWDK